MSMMCIVQQLGRELGSSGSRLIGDRQWSPCVVALSKIYYVLFSTGSTQEVRGGGGGGGGGGKNQLFQDMVILHIKLTFKEMKCRTIFKQIFCINSSQGRGQKFHSSARN